MQHSMQHTTYNAAYNIQHSIQHARSTQLAAHNMQHTTRTGAQLPVLWEPVEVPKNLLHVLLGHLPLRLGVQLRVKRGHELAQRPRPRLPPEHCFHLQGSLQHMCAEAEAIRCYTDRGSEGEGRFEREGRRPE